jgi:hypothetical protein
MAPRLLDAGGHAVDELDRQRHHPGQPVGGMAYRSRKPINPSTRPPRNLHLGGHFYFERTVIMKSKKKLIVALCLVVLIVTCMATPALAAGDVAGAIEGTWDDASDQIKQVVNNVVFPAIDLILAVFFFAKLGMAYFD